MAGRKMSIFRVVSPRSGRVIKSTRRAGCISASSSGRGSGVRLGYSQVANPLYLCGKRRGYPLPRAFPAYRQEHGDEYAARRSWPEPYVDRRGRLHGNLLALRDLMAGRMVPERILDL